MFQDALVLNALTPKRPDPDYGSSSRSAVIRCSADVYYKNANLTHFRRTFSIAAAHTWNSASKRSSIIIITSCLFLFDFFAVQAYKFRGLKQ